MTTGWKGVLFGVCVLGMVSASACNADRSPPSAGGAGGLPNGSGGSGTDSMGGLGGAAFEEARRRQQDVLSSTIVLGCAAALIFAGKALPF